LFGAPGAADGLAQIFNTANRQKTTSVAAFGQFEYEVAPGLRLVAGARYTQDKKSFVANSSFRFQEGGIDNYGAPTGISSISNRLNQSRFNWRLGANYEAAPDVLLYANIATGYKSGGFNGGFIVGDEATRAAALAPVKPETVTSYELGLKSSFWDRRVTLNLAGFYNDYRNQQTLVQVNRDGVIVFTLDNAEKARTYGLDAELSVRPVDGLTLAGQLGLLNSKLTSFVASRDPAAPDYSGNELTFAPPTTLALSADYERDIGTLELRVRYDANYRARHFFDPSNTPYAMTSGYWLHNARIALGFADGRYEVGAFARNLTKTRYVITGSDLTLTTGSVQQVFGQPRMFGIDFNLRY
jgi:iron complex outermembrane receptor protein